LDLTGVPRLNSDSAPAPAVEPAPRNALRELLEGNLRFSHGRRRRTLMWDEDVTLRRKLAIEPQAPIAAILGCADSRTAGNLIFDQELGRLFSVQVAGGFLGPQALASLEFAVLCLGVPLVLVLGHTQCGAIQALEEAGSRPLPGGLRALQFDFLDLVDRLPRRSHEGSAPYVARLAAANAWRQATLLLERSRSIQEAHQQGRVKVVPAIYCLETGRVRTIARAPKAAKEEPGGDPRGQGTCSPWGTQSM